MSAVGPKVRRALYVTAALRALTTSWVGIQLGIYLARIGLSPAAIGAIVTSGLAGAAVAATVATFRGDRIGRQRLLVVVAVVASLGTLGFTFSARPWLLGLFAFAGMLNGMGRDRGAALILEQAALPATADASERTRVIAVYTMLQDVGHALGAMLAGAPAWLERSHALPDVTAHRFGFAGSAGVSLLCAAIYLKLGTVVDAERTREGPRLRPETRRIVTRISSLFALDSLAGGFLTTALLSYFFFERFGASELEIGALFFGARILNAVSHLGAAWLAKRIGLVNTMVFTHIPSSLLLVTVAFAPSFWVAAVMFLLREGLVEMDVPTRQSYVLALVAEEERTLASGVTQLVRVAAWAVAPAFAGALMQPRTMFLPLVIGAALKIAYDVLLWLAFRRLPPPEERVA